MADPQAENKGTTHTYLSRAAWKDAQTWTLVAAFIWFLVQNKEFTDMVPAGLHIWIDRVLVIGLLWQRFYTVTRPVAIFQGTPVEVRSIPPQVPTSVDLGKVGKPIVILMLLGGLAMPSCAKAPPTLSPVGVTAFNATRVVKALDVLRDFAIDAEAQNPKIISTDNTRKIVNFHEAAVKTIHASPGGWKPTVAAALDQLQHDILPAEWQRLAPYISLVKTLMEAV